MAQKSKKKELYVLVRRDSLGNIYSEVWNKMGDDPTKRYFRDAVVIDRANRRGPLTNDTVIARAKSLANLLDIPYDEDLEWHCCRNEGLACHCPDCIKTGKA